MKIMGLSGFNVPRNQSIEGVNGWIFRQTMLEGEKKLQNDSQEPCKPHGKTVFQRWKSIRMPKKATPTFLWDHPDYAGKSEQMGLS